MNSEEINVKVFRFHPGVDLEPRFDEYRLPYSQGATVLGILRYIYENLDPTLAFRQYYCAAMLCGCCRVTVNGERTKSCVALVQPGANLVIEPYDRTKVIRDLAVRFDD